MNPDISESLKEKLSKYPKTEDFEVWDTIGVPHPFTIGPDHVAHASDHFSGGLGEDAIRDLEKKRGKPSCYHYKDKWNRCDLKYDEHEQAVRIKCKKEAPEALKQYCQDIVPLVEKDGYAGFVFMKTW